VCYTPMVHLQTDGAQVFSRWLNEGVPEKHPKRPRDLNQWAKRMVDIATGAIEDREPTPEERGKDPAAVALGKRGGIKGGKSRAGNMTAEQRSAAAKKAAMSRWHRP
jgi:hypothetical protein